MEEPLLAVRRDVVGLRASTAGLHLLSPLLWRIRFVYKNSEFVELKRQRRKQRRCSISTTSAPQLTMFKEGNRHLGWPVCMSTEIGTRQARNVALRQLIRTSSSFGPIQVRNWSGAPSPRVPAVQAELAVRCESPLFPPVKLVACDEAFCILVFISVEVSTLFCGLSSIGSARFSGSPRNFSQCLVSL